MDMDPLAMINAAVSTLGHIPKRSRGLQKNVADDVMLKLVEGMTRRRYKTAELKSVLDGLTVHKTHKPDQRKLSIRYERE